MVFLACFYPFWLANVAVPALVPRGILRAVARLCDVHGRAVRRGGLGVVRSTLRTS